MVPVTPRERYLRLLWTYYARLDELLGQWPLPDDPFSPEDWFGDEEDTIIRSVN
ncbi:hypothetical protein Jasper_41 [Mycobacterium phage Jasper]|uniref:Uncharacterized protein n=2 Tax=Fromanvirus jasper TaxID=540065 RepID=B3VGS9_9CAUD|nr:hypothetical protein Jasper_41 [Mycobacterium phage Jasper]YP_009014030.1 hypothetical protein CL62_gp41 [Mycobacterium phage Dreamboat]ACE80056.1 hypothetical protein Jasper_41 [Mycobacterium phage Jasper]AEO94330.1 hypothetical protein DREAMBOAT_41 [Mycobacterium phage Dreamboat]